MSDLIAAQKRGLPDRERAVSTVGIVGGGNIGAGWAGLLMLAGYKVIVHDTAADAQDRLRRSIESALPAIAKRSPGTIDWALLRFGEMDDLASVDFVIEAGPERLDVKRQIIRSVDAVVPADVVIGSCTGGFQMSELQQDCRHPERVILFHPLNPAHLMPVVEIGGGAAVADWAVRAAEKLLSALGKDAIVLRKESIGHLTNRLQAAILREAAHCLVTGVASAEDIDKAVTLGLGLRWAAVGPLMTMHLAGGAGGMAGIIAHAGEAVQSWWDDLGQPRLDQETSASLVVAAQALSAGRSLSDLTAHRDAMLVQLVALARSRGERPASINLHETA